MYYNIYICDYRDSLLKMLGTSQKVVTRLNGVVKEMEEKEKVNGINFYI